MRSDGDGDDDTVYDDALVIRNMHLFLIKKYPGGLCFYLFLLVRLNRILVLLQ